MCTSIVVNKNKTIIGWNLDLLDMEYRVRPSDDGVYIEILSGLSEGDAVVVGSVDGLSDGMKVNIRPEGGE